MRIGKLKCGTKKPASGFEDGLLDLVCILLCDSAFVQKRSNLCAPNQVGACNSHVQVLGKCVPGKTLMLAAGPVPLQS